MAVVRGLFVLVFSVWTISLLPGALTQNLTFTVPGPGGSLVTRVGCKVVLSCSGVGVQIEWIRFGAEEPIITVTGNGTVLQVEIIFDPIDISARGAYTCELQNDSSVSSVNVLLFVEQDPIDVQLTETSIDISTYFIGESVSISCPVSTCYDNVQVMLLKGNELIEEGTLAGNTLGRVYNFSLEVTDSIAGTYTCKAELNGTSDMDDFDITGQGVVEICFPSCLNGICVDGECVCSPAYTGSGCGEFVDLDLYFMNDTPILFGSGTVIAEFRYTPRPGLTVECHLTRVDLTRDDCSSGRYERNDILPGDYSLRVVAKDPSTGERAIIRSRLFVHGDNDYCTVQLINRGVTVSGNSATVEFRGSGIVTQYACVVDRQEYMPCQSPFTVTGLDPGSHQVKINPTDCGTDYRATRATFDIK